MHIIIEKNTKLHDGEVYSDGEIIIETEQAISISLIRGINEKGDLEPKMYLQIGNFLSKDFKDFELSKKDTIYIKK